MNNPSHIQLVAVQMTLNIEDYWTADKFRTKIRSLMAKAASRIDSSTPALVVFPEDVGLMLALQGLEEEMTSVTSIESAVKTAAKKFLFPLTFIKLRHRLSWVPALYLYRHKLIAETYFDVFSDAAAKYGVYLVAGSVVLPPYEIIDGAADWKNGSFEPNVYNSSYFFGPDGKIIGRQRKRNLVVEEKEDGLDLAKAPMDSFEVFDTPLGKVGIAICYDAFTDQVDDVVVDILAEKGADILVQPSANPGPWNTWQQEDWLSGCYRQVVDTGRFTYGINPMMNGFIWDMAFYGQSSILSSDADGDNPELIGYKDIRPMRGFLNVANSDASEEILVSTVPRP